MEPEPLFLATKGASMILLPLLVQPCASLRLQTPSVAGSPFPAVLAHWARLPNRFAFSTPVGALLLASSTWTRSGSGETLGAEERVACLSALLNGFIWGWLACITLAISGRKANRSFGTVTGLSAQISLSELQALLSGCLLDTPSSVVGQTSQNEHARNLTEPTVSPSQSGFPTLSSSVHGTSVRPAAWD